jgi:hypothetical protein
MKVLTAILIILLWISLTSCSLIKTKTDRCFDLMDQYKTANVHVKIEGRETFSCTNEQ